MPRPQASRGTSLFPKAQRCPCPFVDMFLERLVATEDEIMDIETIYQGYRGLLWQLGRGDDTIGTKARLSRALARSALTKAQRNRRRGYLCRISQWPEIGFSDESFGQQLEQLAQRQLLNLSLRKVAVGDKLHAVAKKTIRQNEVVCRLRGEVTSKRTHNQRAVVYKARGLPQATAVVLRSGYILDPLTENMEDNAGMWPRKSQHANLQRIRFYQGQSFKGVYWVAVQNIYIGEELIGDPIHVKEVTLV